MLKTLINTSDLDMLVKWKKNGGKMEEKWYCNESMACVIIVL